MGYRLLTEDYCESCPAFEAHVSLGQDMYINGKYEFTTATVIDCKHRDRCEAIKKHLEKQLREGLNCTPSPREDDCICFDTCRHWAKLRTEYPCNECFDVAGAPHYSSEED